MKTRKNINCLSEEELHDLREAFAAIYALPESSPHSFAKIAGLHGNPPPSYCIHANEGFLSWHRAYILELENALRSIHCGVSLPFWKWSFGDTTGVPEACTNPTYINRDGDEVPNPLYSGPKPSSVGGGETSRRSDIDTTTFGDLATTAQAAIANTDWTDFVSDLNNVHGSLHVRIGGDMSTVSTAGFDPIFFLHHCNVDRLWANWQVEHPMSLPASEADAVLEPFTKPFSSDWHVGSDFENISDWDYQYQNWCLKAIPIPDWLLERIVKIPIGPWVFASRRVAVSVSAAMMPHQSFELLVFVNNPEPTAGQEPIKQKGYAGSIGIFGMGDAQMLEGRSKEFKMTLDITAQLRKLVNRKDKEFTISLQPALVNDAQGSEAELKMLNVNLEID